MVVGAEYAIQVLKKILGKFPKTALSSKDFPLDEIMNLISERMTEATGSAILNQLDVKLSSRMSEATGTSILGQLDIKLSQLRDDLRGIGNKTLTDIYDKLSNIFGTVVVSQGTVNVANIDRRVTGTVVVSSGTVNVANIERTVSGTVTVDNILGTVSSSVAGTVTVDNFPSEYPLPSTQVSDLKKVSVESGTVAVDTVAGTVSVNVKSSIAYDSANDRFKTSVENFPSWFTDSTKKTDDIESHLGISRDFFAKYFQYVGGGKANARVAGYSEVFWSDGTDYSFTNTSYAEINYCNLHGLMFGWLGVSTEIKGDGTNTVYCKVTDRAGHILYEWSTTSSTAVRTWRKGFMAYWTFPDFNRIRIYCKVDSGTGYLTNVYAVMPAEDNRKLVFGWNWEYTDGSIIPLRVDSNGRIYAYSVVYDEEESAYVVPRADRNNYLIVKPWEDQKQNAFYVSGMTSIGASSSASFTVYDGKGVLKWLEIFVSDVRPDYVTIKIKSGDTVLASIRGDYFMGVLDPVNPTEVPNTSPYCGCWRWDTTNNKYYGWRVINTRHATNIVIEVANSSSATAYVKIQAIYIPY